MENEQINSNFGQIMSSAYANRIMYADIHIHLCFSLTYNIREGFKA